MKNTFMQNPEISFIIWGVGVTGSDTALVFSVFMQAGASRQTEETPDSCWQRSDFLPRPGSFPNPRWRLKLSKVTEIKPVTGVLGGML